MSADAAARHLTTPALLEHWNAGVPVLIPMAGEPPLALRIDPTKGWLTLRAPVSPDASLPINTLAHVHIELAAEDDVHFLEISTTDARLVVDGYAMLTTVADRIQIDGAPPIRALDETLATWRSILTMRLRMSVHEEVGLVGELLVAEAMFATRVASVEAWRGGIGEEHDFGFADADVEVKTTAGERREHWIHGLAQLVGSGDTPLWMLSIQITRAGAGTGRTLPELIDDLVSMATTEDASSLLIQRLGAAGWRDDQRDLFSDRWRLRSPPLALRVDSDFPRLTSHGLSAAGVDVSAVRRVSYEIDVTDRPASTEVPATISALVREMTEDGSDG